MSDLAFLVDICGHLNDLNLKLQGKNKTIINTLPAVQAFFHKLELFLVDVQELCNLKVTDIDEIEEGFYLKASTKAEYPQLAQLGRWLYTVFAATYICESAFSYMNNIKSKLRSTLTQDHLCQLLRIACCSREQDYQEIMSSHKQSHVSH
ncbi:protein FAM200A-like [Watersipora subatra]|uniref:protein FAM200A-like n=1 Tax=Watersipora subatra TaxID=2589382 RepID=UPI00355C01A1